MKIGIMCVTDAHDANFGRGAWFRKPVLLMHNLLYRYEQQRRRFFLLAFINWPKQSGIGSDKSFTVYVIHVGEEIEVSDPKDRCCKYRKNIYIYEKMVTIKVVT